MLFSFNEFYIASLTCIILTTNYDSVKYLCRSIKALCFEFELRESNMNSEPLPALLFVHGEISVVIFLQCYVPLAHYGKQLTFSY